MLIHDPERIAALAELGELHLEEGRPSDAVEAYLKGAEVSFSKGLLEEAAALYARVLAVEPSQPLATSRIAELGRRSR